MKIAILLLLFGTFSGGCMLQNRHDIKFLNEASELKIPGDITDIRYQYVKNGDYNYPYDFYSRFRCDSEVYLVIRKQIFIGDKPGINDENLYISSRMLVNDKKYLDAYGQLDWWDIRKSLKCEKIYVNYFEDRGEKHIGDSTNFNGKIAIYYNNPYCYVYIGCNPPG
jgi:hypothetical protein